MLFLITEGEVKQLPLIGISWSANHIDSLGNVSVQLACNNHLHIRPSIYWQANGVRV